jgi:hypothetical protein
MTLSGNRIVRAMMVGSLATALVALWRAQSGSGVDPFPDQALRALGSAIGFYLGDMVLARFLPRRRPARHRSILVRALGMGMGVSLLFASTGLLNGADWTMSQWGIALVSGGLVGTLVGALFVWFSNAACVRGGQTA